VAKAGADAIKFQTYRAANLYAPNPGKVDYLSAKGTDEDVDELLKRREMPYEEIPLLAQAAQEEGIEFMSTPFSPQDFEVVDPHVSRHKIASYEIAYLPLLKKVAESKKPVILSTGGSNIEEIAWSVGQLQNFGCTDLTLLQCTAAYPADPTSMNLSAIKTLHQAFGLPIGLSDHSLDDGTAAIMAVGFGATVIEKQVTLSCDLPGPHQKLSLETSKLASFVEKIRLAEKMVGSGHKQVLEQEKELFYFAKRAVQATRDIKEGEEFIDGENVALLRPGKNKKGAHPSKLSEISGKKASHAIKAGEGVMVEDVR
jgi:N-acetylneuraminate synthase